MGSEPGRLVIFEGVDGCGKSTQARLLAESLGAVLTLAPGGTQLGARLREILLHSGDMPIGGRSELLLLAADRAQHVDEVIEPALAQGRWVVSDRFSGSTYAYQGYGRGMSMEVLDDVIGWATGGLQPDLTVLIDVPVELGLSRRSRRGAGTGTGIRQTSESDHAVSGDEVSVSDASGDRIESLGLDFQRRVAEGFLDLATSDPDHWVVIDGTAQVDVVAAQVLREVARRLSPPAPDEPPRPATSDED